MFFGSENPFKYAHELVGIGFSVAIVLHIYTNWRPFKRYFSQRGVIIIALALFVGVSLVTRTAIFDRGEPEELIMDKMEQTSLEQLAPLVGLDVKALVEQIGDYGFDVEDPGMSVEEIANQNGADTDDILLSVFR